MMLRVFTIKDRATECYHNPFYLLTVAEAKRIFTQMANDPESKISSNPEDFTLFHIGDFDNNTGFVNQDQGLVNLGNAQEYKEREEQRLLKLVKEK